MLAHPSVTVNAATSDGVTPLFIAAQHGNIEIMRLLLGTWNMGAPCL